MKRVLQLSLLLFLLVMLACGESLLLTASCEGQEAQFVKAAQIYSTYCVQCHGLNKNGKGINSKDMTVQPRDHSDPKGMGDLPDEELFKAIKDGGLAVNKSILMPAWSGVLNEEEVKDLVAYLRHLCQCGASKTN